MTTTAFVDNSTDLTAAQLNTAFGDSAALGEANTFLDTQTYQGKLVQTPGAGTNNNTPFLQAADLVGDYITVTGTLVTPVPTSATLTASLLPGVAYAGGQRVSLAAAVANTYPDSSDTYVDLTSAGALVYSSVANGATAPAVAANSLRLEKVVTAPITSPMPTITASTAAGTLAAGTYAYGIVAHDGTGYGVLSAVATITTSATGENVLTWSLPLNYTTFDVYGRTSGATNLLVSGLTTSTWTDNGSINPGAAPPSTATSNAIQTVDVLAPLSPTVAAGVGNYGGVLADYPSGTLPTTCWGKAVQARSGATLTLPAVNPPAGSKLVLYGEGQFYVASNSGQFLYSPVIGAINTNGPITINVSDGGWIEITAGGNGGEYDITGGSLLVFQNTSPSFKNSPQIPEATAGGGATNLTQVQNLIISNTPYDIVGGFSGSGTSNQIVLLLPVVRSLTFPNALAGSVGIAGTAFTAAATYTITVNGTTVGTIAFAASGTVPTFTTSSTSGFTAAPGDTIEVTGPATADSSGANVTFTLMGGLA